MELKWIQLWLPFMISSFFIMVLSWYYFRGFKRKYEKVLGLFEYVDTYWVERDKERYKLLMGLLTKDTDLVYRYQFDLGSKECFVVSEKGRKELQQKRNQGGHRQNLKVRDVRLSAVPSMVAYLVVASAFIILSTLITVQTQLYLQKYRPTTLLYRLMSDLSFYIPGSFAQREMLYHYWLFPYYTEVERVGLRDLIDNGVDHLEEFNKMLLNLEK